MNMNLRTTKFLILITFICALMGVLMLGKARAADAAGSTGGPSGTNLSTVFISAGGGPNGSGIPRIHFLSATSDVNTATVRFYKSSAAYKITAASFAGTNRVFTDSAAAFATTNQTVALRHVATDTYERMTNFSSTATSVTFTMLGAASVAKGDELYILTLDNFSLPLGTAVLKEWNNTEGIYLGQELRPLMIEVPGTTASRLQAVSWRFIPNQ